MKTILILFLFISCNSKVQESPAPLNRADVNFEKLITESTIYNMRSDDKYTESELKECLIKKNENVIKYKCHVKKPQLSVAFFGNDEFYIVREKLIVKNQKRHKTFENYDLVINEARYLFGVLDGGELDYSLSDPLDKLINTYMFLKIIKNVFPKYEVEITDLRFDENGYFQTIVNDNGEVIIKTTNHKENKYSNQKVAKLVKRNNKFSIEALKNEKRD